MRGSSIEPRDPHPEDHPHEPRQPEPPAEQHHHPLVAGCPGARKARPKTSGRPSVNFSRYGGAIRRYLRAALRDPDTAEELFQEFALHFLNSDFRHADPQRGRFRDYVKTSLVHLIGNYHKRRQRQPRPLPPGHPGPPVEAPAGPDLDPVFLASWRDELLARAWQALAQAEGPGHPPLYTVLRFRADHPELSSHEMADRLGARLGRPPTAVGVRQMLHRARERFADRLIEEVAHSLGDPTPERLAEELIDLGLYEYCRPALQRRGAEG